MIEPGYNGIEFGKYTEEQFLERIPKHLVEFCKLITHRDTQDKGDVWRVQGTIHYVDFISCVMSLTFGLSDITSLCREGNSANLRITINILNTTQL